MQVQSKVAELELDLIRAETDALLKIASTPLPDSSFLNAAECSPSSNDIGERNSHASKHDDTHGLDVAKFHNEIKSLLEEETSRSTWSLNILGNTIFPDIRTLKLDASRLLSDPDGDKASLYWYVRTKSISHPDHDFLQDRTFHTLVDRVLFGFSIQSMKAKEEENADIQATRLADKLMRAMEAVKTLQKHNASQREKDAASVIQQFDEQSQDEVRQNMPDVSRDETAKKDSMINTTSSAATDPLNQSRENHSKVILHTPQTSPVYPHDLNEHRSPSKPEQKLCANQAEDLRNAVTSNASRAYSWFMDGFMSKIEGTELDGTMKSALGSCNAPLSCRRIREVFSPLLAEFTKAGSIYGITDPSVLVDVIHDHFSSKSKTLTSTTFVGIVLAIASSLLDNLVDTMGGKEAVAHASLLLYKHFVFDNKLSADELRNFLRDVATSGESRIPALFLGRLLDKAGNKDGKSGLHIMNSFTKPFERAEAPDIPQPIFLKWLASLKPKFSAKELEDLLTDITCPTDNNVIRMSRFGQICLPAPKGNSGSLKRKLKFIFSDHVVGPTWVDQVIECCQEKDLPRSGLIGWKEFLEVLDEAPILLTACEANQLASNLADKASFVKVKYFTLTHFIDR